MLTFKYLRKIQMLNILFIIDIINFPYKHYCKNVATYLLFVNVSVTIELRANIETNRSNIKPSVCMLHYKLVSILKFISNKAFVDLQNEQKLSFVQS